MTSKYWEAHIKYTGKFEDNKRHIYSATEASKGRSAWAIAKKR